MEKLVRKASNPTNQIGFPGVSTVYLKEILGSNKRVECLYQMIKPLRFVNEAVSLTDLERNRFLYVNPAWVKLYGYSARQVLGKDVAPLINSPDIPSGVLQAIRTQTRKGNWEGCLMNRNKKGDEFKVNLRTACLTDSDNKTLGMIGLATVFNDEVAHGASLKNNNTQRKSNEKFATKQFGQLTPRELEIFSLFGHGLNTRQVAEKLGISVYTVQTHRNHLKKKLGAINSTELNLMAFKSTD